MLSAEKLPPDPPCPPPQLIKDLDLSNQTLLDDDDDNSNSQLPKFSIRDYVFTARSKDLKTNWPFSQKNLQRCLRHGVKEVLPPFQSLESVRNQPFRIRCTVEDENRSNLNIATPSRHVDHDHAVLDLSNNAELKKRKLAEACTDTTTISCRSEGENDFPSTITSISQSEIEESVPINRPSSSAIETDTSLEAASVEVKAAGPRTIVSKTGRTTRPPPGKKCRLVVKYNNQSDRNSKEDISSNCSTISETMTSKVCPVCKTFSSSSNTTLNAHIDQCLSGESTTPKCIAEESKATTRYRIKPRKTKMMVDIYETAQHCTLEDLDRRNGSSWASTVSSVPTNHDKEKSDQMPAEVKRQRVSSVYPEPEDIDVGAVYVDASGTKVRILSKFDDKPAAPASKVLEHLQPIKPLKGGKGGKFFSAKKKKHHKYLKLAPQSRNLFSPKAHSSEFHEEEESYGLKESFKEGRHQLEKEVNPYNPLALRPWACSKRTGVGKKLHQKDDHQAVKSSWNKSRDLLDVRNQTCLPVEGNCVGNFSASLISSPERNSSTEDEFSDSEASDKSDCSQRKRAGSPTLEAGMSDNIERARKRNTRHFSNHSNSSQDGVYEPVFINTAVGTAASPSEGYGSPPAASAQPSEGRGASRPSSLKFPSSKKTALSVGSQLSTTEYNAAFVKKLSAVKTAQVDKGSEIDRDVDRDSEDDRGYDFMYNCAGKQSRRRDNNNEASPRRSTVLQMRRNRRLISNPRRRETTASKSSQFMAEHSGYDERSEMVMSGTVGDELVAKADGFGLVQKEDHIPGDDIITESSSLLGIGKTVTRFCNPVDSHLNVPGHHSKAKSSCLQYKGSVSEPKALTSPTDQRINNDQDIFCVDEGEDKVGHSAEEMDSEVGQGSYFAEVDPIPIPGPPGSFLPSPRDMGSDEFQGNSSLTTSRIQSSQDQLELLVDADTSDSPISTTSTISHSTGTYRDHRFSEPLSSKGSQCAKEKIVSGVSSGAASDASIETNAAAVQQITGNLAERHTFDRESFRVDKISLERGPIGYKSKDDQPCCCQRKERNSEVLALNYQESPLLRRRAMTSVMPATMGKQMGCPITRTNNSEISSDTTEAFFLNGCPSSRPEQISIPVAKLPCVPVPLKGSPDGKGKFSSHSDSGSSVSPSASNSILRLMGKNLMVVNRDEDASAVPSGQVKPNTQMNHVTSQYPAFSSGISPGSLQNQVCPSFHNNQAHGSVIVGQDPYNQMGECFDEMRSMSFRSYINPMMPPVQPRGAPSLFPKKKADGGFYASMEPQEYKGGYHFPIPLHKPVSKPIGATTFHKGTANSASSGSKEIIVIDDSEADHLNAVNYSDRLRESQAASAGILIPATSSYSSKRPNAPLFQSPEQPSLLCGSPVLYNTNFHAIPSRRAHASPVGWNCTTDGSGMLQQPGPFHATSTPSRGLYMTSTLYNPPSLS